jgi:hypothetical protein
VEAAFPALILFLVLLVRLYALALKQPQETGARFLCRLHRWERTEDGIVCKECGMHPTVD